MAFVISYLSETDGPVTSSSFSSFEELVEWMMNNGIPLGDAILVEGRTLNFKDEFSKRKMKIPKKLI